MVVFPNAKINIGLRILGKREDGFHNLESIFYPVKGLFDVLEVIEDPSAKGGTCLVTNFGVPISSTLENNLIVRAYRLLHKRFSIPPVSVYLKKVIPMGAGLGGGSSDAAFMLTLLNQVFSLKIGPEALFEYSMELGSDCGFFIHNEPALVTGRGEKVRQLDLDLRGKVIVMLKPSVSVSTKAAFEGVEVRKKPAYPKKLNATSIADWSMHIDNDFEDSVFREHSVLGELKSRLIDWGAQFASMTGTGAVVYGIFDRDVTLPELPKDLWSWMGKL